jgi:hypothetical protein
VATGLSEARRLAGKEVFRADDHAEALHVTKTPGAVIAALTYVDPRGTRRVP